MSSTISSIIEKNNEQQQPHEKKQVSTDEIVLVLCRCANAKSESKQNV